jgi:hypothetical protein
VTLSTSASSSILSLSNVIQDVSSNLSSRTSSLSSSIVTLSTSASSSIVSLSNVIRDVSSNLSSRTSSLSSSIVTLSTSVSSSIVSLATTPSITTFIEVPRIHEKIVDFRATLLSSAIIAGTTSSYNYANGAIVYTAISGGSVGTPTTASMSLFNIPTPSAGVCAYTTTFIINQQGSSKGYIRTIGVNNIYSPPVEFIGGLPTITTSTSTVIQTITAVVSNNGALLKMFTNSTVCSGTV